jgi:hypothetical protein
MRPIHVTGPLSAGTPRAIGADASSYPSLVSLLVGFIAIALVVAGFGVLSIPCAAVAMLLGSRARREVRDTVLSVLDGLSPSPGGSASRWRVH